MSNGSSEFVIINVLLSLLCLCVCVCDLTFEGECNVISHVTLEFSFTWFLLQRSVLLLKIYLKISL